MTVVQALVLGIIQGLTEFLADLEFPRRIHPGGRGSSPLDRPGSRVRCRCCIWGTLDRGPVGISAPSGCRPGAGRYWGIVRHGGRVQSPEELRVVLLIIATIPGAIAGVLLEKRAEDTFRSPLLIAGTLAVMGVLLWAVDKWAPADRSMDKLGVIDAVWIGLAQILALVPGVSRSGSTITAGRALKLDRESAAVFSFSLSMPIDRGRGGRTRCRTC